MDSISKSTQSLTTAEDMRNQTKLTMQPYANWENYLTPAPLSIAILGELVFISSSTDFSINKNPPKDGYKFIKYPDSFRACLMQVCHSGWWAFNEAHTNMDQIRLHTAQVPDYMKRAVKILFQDDDEIVNAHLPDQLGNIQIIAEECLQLSNATAEQFKNVLSIIQELLQACMNAKLIYGTEREEIKKKLEENELKKKSAEQAKKNTEKAVSRLEKELDEADEKYKKALDSLPTGWNMIAMDVVGGLMQGITGLITGLTYVVTNPVNQMCSVTTKIADTMSHIKSQECMNVVDEINLYSKSNEILCSVNIIKEKMEVSDLDDDIKWNNLYDQKEKYTKTDFIKQQFKRIKSDLQKIPDCRPKTQAQSLCKKGIEICEQLAKYAPSGKCDKVKSSEIIDEVLNLIKSAQIFDSKSKDITKSPAISPNPPMLNKQESKLENPGQRVIENARFVIEQTRTQLNQTKDEHGKCVENLKISENELNDILVTLRNCTLQDIDFNTTIQMLSKGMKAMGKVEEQWQKMVNFFQIVSNIVKISLNKTLTNFGSTAKTTQVLSYNQKLFSKDLLYIQAFQASNIASFVHMISGTYTDVSNKYLMNPVGSLSKLMAMDISDPEFKRERKQFENSCDEAQRGISKLVLKNKEEFERNSTARLERIDQELLAILPAAPPEQIKSIQEAVQAGFSEEAAASYY